LLNWVVRAIGEENTDTDSAREENLAVSILEKLSNVLKGIVIFS